MIFWVFMLIIVLVIPAAMIYLGQSFMKKAPDEINFVFGYRTTRSMKNKDTWSFAHKCIGKWWYISGVIILPLSIIDMLFMMGKGTKAVGLIVGIIVLVQMLLLGGAIIPTENALKRNFDEFGKRRF